MRTLAPSLLGVLDGIYAALRKDHPDLPRALVTVEEPHPAVKGRVASWRPGRYMTASGIFEGRIAFCWPSPHRRMVPWVLYAPAADVLEAVVHEAAHALATVRKVKDTSREGSWHNARYKALAEELGLVVEKTERGGWTGTSASPELLARYRRHLVKLDGTRPASRTPWPPCGSSVSAHPSAR